MVIEAIFRCNHCNVKAYPNDINTSIYANDYDLVYIPKGWGNFGKDKHLCKKCNKEFNKQKSSYFQ